MISALPPLAELHRSRWKRVGQFFNRIPLATSTAPAVSPDSKLQTKESYPSTGGETATVKHVLSGLMPTAVPASIFTVDLKRERAEQFFKRLVWKRVGPETLVPLPADQMLRVEEPIVEARSFFSNQIPWQARGEKPASPKVGEEEPGGLDLQNLMTAATQQALHAARKRSKVRRPIAISNTPRDNSAASFFSSLSWNVRLPQTNL